MKGKILLANILLFLAIITMNAQSNSHFRIDDEIDWIKQSIEQDHNFGTPYFPYTFDQAEFQGADYRIPIYIKRIKISHGGTPSFAIKVKDKVKWNNIDLPESEIEFQDWKIWGEISNSRNEYFLTVYLIPMIRNKGYITALKDFSINIQIEKNDSFKTRNGEYTLFSVLSEGSIYKIPVNESGIYKIDYNYLSSLGLSPENLDPSGIQLYGNGGQALAEGLSEERVDDLSENPLYFSGNEDHVFNENEFFLFYAEGPDVWRFDPESGKYLWKKNIYDTKNYYFLKVDGDNGLRIPNRDNFTSSTYLSSISDFPQVHELDKTNLLAQYDHTEGTGQNWYGESFFITKEQDFSSFFNFDSMLPSEGVQVYGKLAARNSSGSSFTLNLDETSLSKTINGVSVSSPEATYARDGIIETEFQPSKKIEKVIVQTNAYQAWLDKLQITTRVPINYSGNPIVFSDRFSLENSEASFLVESDQNDILIWDISEATSVISQKYIAIGNSIEFSYPSSVLRKFVAFDPAEITNTPEIGEKIDKQNIHEIFDADMLIIYHEDFVNDVERLASHRRNFNGYEVHTVDISKIYNEFSSGRQDPTAVRNLAKMVYDRNPDFKFLLLFGDGSYDYRAIINPNDNDNFVPVYETMQSLNPISGYVSDDFFALLSDEEGYDLIGDMDISVGRLPVRNTNQAKNIVDKIIEYETSPSNDGDWQNRIAMLADDEDASRHLDQTETVAKFIKANYPVFNLEKIYFDAFQQEVNPGGHRYPEANKSINDNIFKGVLAMTYIGHGGPGGFAQERVLRHEDINSWNNGSKLPLLITATCSFTGFDDPAINTAGEASILKENGGVIALFSTVRLVYSNENSKLINAVFNQVFNKYDGQYLKLGEVLRYAKNSIGNKDNKRKFFLFGDPAMKLALPEYKVYTSAINGIDVQNSTFPDTIKALSKVKVEGFVGNDDGNIMDGFNGVVYTTVFDKAQHVQTLGNDSNSPRREFEIQKKVLFKGSSTVTNGQFSFEFIIPKDINYSYGEGKISYYFSKGDNKDGNGEFSSFIIGGTSDEEIDDDQGPEIQLYLNHTDFKSGDITNNRPILLAYINDDTGINVSGTSIGHDPICIVDDDDQQYYKLNDFFESKMDDYTSGIISFPLDQLEPGLHTLNVEAWDLLNNKGEASIEFVVAEEEEQILKNIFSYPNPSSAGSVFSFEHTLPDTELDVEVSIFDIRGSLIRVVRKSSFTDGFKVDGIYWEGRDYSSNPLSNGVYVYNIKVHSNVLGISIESDFEKLVILK